MNVCLGWLAPLLLLGACVVGAAENNSAVFEDITRAAGIDFTYDNGMVGHRHLAEIMGGGVAFIDYDNDGDLDIYLVQGARLDEKDTVTPGPGRDRLLRNDLKIGPGKRREPSFVDVTDKMGLKVDGYGMGVTTGDFDGDGWTDLYVVQFGPNRLLRNDAGRRFVDVTKQAGAASPGFAASAAFCDYDRDGRLDLYVAQYVYYEPVKCFRASTQRDYCGPKSYRPARDTLLHNLGGGRFEEVGNKLLGPHRTGAGLGVVCGDFGGDDWPDFYVANDGADNNLWINQAGRGFVDDGLLAGVAVNRTGQAEASMGIALGDVDEDGDEDLFLTHLAGETNTFYTYEGDGLLEDRTIPSGLSASSLSRTGFGTAFIDYDNDGRLDLIAVNGAVHLPEEPKDPQDPLPLHEPNQLFHNVGEGRFVDVSARAGAPFALEETSRGLAVGDIDNDGDVDVLVGTLRGPARLLRNRVGQDEAWLGVRVLDRAGKSDALGARVVLRRTGAPHLWRRIGTDGSYASASDPRVLFGLAAGKELTALEVHGLDGSVETWPAPEPGRYITLRRGTGQDKPRGPRR